MNRVKDPFNSKLDPAIPTVVLALNPEYMTEQFQNLSTVCRVGESLQIKSIEVIRHKPEKRCLIEYTCELKSEKKSRTLVFLGKIRTNRSGKRDYRLQQCLWSGGFSRSHTNIVSVARPMGRLKSVHMWLQKKVVGKNLTNLLSKPESLSIMPTIAYAAHKIHTSDLRVERQHTLLDELTILKNNFQLVSTNFPHLETRLHHLLKKACFISNELHDRKLRPIHRDFYSDQIIVAPSKNVIYVVDFDLFCMGDPAVDIGNFIGHLTEYAIRICGNEQALQDHEDALLASFISFAGDKEYYPVKVYTLLTLMRHIYLSTLFPERQAFMMGILNLCEQRIVSSDYTTNTSVVKKNSQRGV